jgi:hypothetical protein
VTPSNVIAMGIRLENGFQHQQRRRRIPPLGEIICEIDSGLQIQFDVDALNLDSPPPGVWARILPFSSAEHK